MIKDKNYKDKFQKSILEQKNDFFLRMSLVFLPPKNYYEYIHPFFLRAINYLLLRRRGHCLGQSNSYW